MSAPRWLDVPRFIGFLEFCRWRRRDCRDFYARAAYQIGIAAWTQYLHTAPLPGEFGTVHGVRFIESNDYRTFDHYKVAR